MSLQTAPAVVREHARFNGWDALRVALLLLLVGLVGASALLGSKAASFHDLQRDLDSGQVRTVVVAGRLPAGADGYVGQQVRWRKGLRQYHAAVLEVSPGSQRPADVDRNLVALHRDVGAWLNARYPELRVARGHQILWDANMLGWQVPTWIGLVALCIPVAGLVLLVAGPQPWRATRWAWFWLCLNPVGALAFLLLSGPTPPLPIPRRPSRRLTGGWAFLLSLLLASIVGLQS